jgi:glycosyltransferase involved in cell wall biosynthesis
VNILLTVHQFFPEHASGTEVLTLSVAKELLRRGHRVIVLTGFPQISLISDAQRFDTYEYDGLIVHRFRHAYVPMGGQAAVAEIEYDNHLVSKYFQDLVRDFTPDVIHLFHLSRLGAGLIDVAAQHNIPTYYTPTDFWSVCPTSQLLLPNGRQCLGPTKFSGNCAKHMAQATSGAVTRSLSRLIPDGLADVVAGLTARGLMPAYPHALDVAAVARRPSFVLERINKLRAILAPTRWMTRILTLNGVNPNLIVQTPYGIDLPTGAASRIVRDQSRPLVVGFIGTLAHHKGCHVLIEAIRRMEATRIHLKIYGSPLDFPEYAATLQRLAREAPNISFCGTFPNNQIAEILAGIDVLVVPSLWTENTPLVVYSALAAQRPVIASDFPGLAEAVIHEHNGLTFAPGDINALQSGLQRALDETALLPRLSAHCEKPKSTSEYVDELMALYEARA